ncbi:MAG: DUF2269 family protein [Ignavibacteriaceae bacterium]
MGALIMKLLHVIFVILFLGNIIVAVFWKRHADKSNNPAIMAHTLRGIIRADRMFTMPGVTGLIIFGFGAMGIYGYPFSTGWILWSIVLVIISGFAFMAKLVPIQKKLLAMTESPGFNRQEYDSLSKQWDLWGTIATAAPVIAVILMVLRWPY